MINECFYLHKNYILPTLKLHANYILTTSKAYINGMQTIC